jgi:hypothetical protein
VLPAKRLAKRVTKTPASAVARTVMTSMAEMVMVSSRLVNSAPPSGFLAALTSCGTSTELSTPPAMTR